MINTKTTLKELAFIVGDHLSKEGVHALLVGGGVVSIYTDNKYESYDLDFISPDSYKNLTKAMGKLGFKTEGRHFVHPDTIFFVEFPGSILIIGDEYQEAYDSITFKNKSLKIMSPTQSIMDRLAAFYHWDDRESLDQAVMIAEAQPFSLNKVKTWSEKEGEPDKFLIFQERIRNIKKHSR
jgi:hypothetical protein